MSFARGIMGLFLAGAVSLTSTGCIRRVLMNGTIDGTHRGSDAVQTLQDFEIARAVARGGLAQLEGLHRLAPYNEDGLFMLTRGWGGATYAFTEDEWELAQIGGDDVQIRYHMNRTVAGFKRARFYGIELLKRRADGFDAASKNAMKMAAWLKENFADRDDAEILLWTGYAWMSHVQAAKDRPAVVGELYIGSEIVKRSAELDSKLEYGLAHTILGAYHARTAMAELDESKKHFELALKINEGKYLPTVLNFATKYYCAKSDQATYEKLLNQVLKAGDELPKARLPNVIAKRRARRYLGNKIFQEDCGFRG